MLVEHLQSHLKGRVPARELLHNILNSRCAAAAPSSLVGKHPVWLCGGVALGFHLVVRRKECHASSLEGCRS